MSVHFLISTISTRLLFYFICHDRITQNLSCFCFKCMLFPKNFVFYRIIFNPQNSLFCYSLFIFRYQIMSSSLVSYFFSVFCTISQHFHKNILAIFSVVIHGSFVSTFFAPADNSSFEGYVKFFKFPRYFATSTLFKNHGT